MKDIIDQISEEKDAEIRQFMKAKIETLKIQKRSYEEQLQAEKNRRSPFSTVKDRLSVIRHAQNLFQNGGKEEKLKVLKVLGSNWNVAGDIVDYKANFEAQAVEKARNYYVRGLSKVRTDKKGFPIMETLIRETSDFLWSG